MTTAEQIDRLKRKSKSLGYTLKSKRHLIDNMTAEIHRLEYEYAELVGLQQRYDDEVVALGEKMAGTIG